jgi:hypothetical protein
MELNPTDEEAFTLLPRSTEATSAARYPVRPGLTSNHQIDSSDEEGG